MLCLCTCLIVVASLLSSSAYAQEIRINSQLDLQAVLDNASRGDTIVLSPGVYAGNFVIRQSLTIQGEKGAIINAQGMHDGIRIKAPHVTIENLTIENWGDDLTAMNAGIFIEKSAQNTTIKNNLLHGDTSGIWLDKCDGAKIINNKISGNEQMRSTDRGNGIHLSVATNTEVRGNEIWHTRDGIYIISSQNNLLTENHMHDLRYGVHYMYSHSNTVTKNKAVRTRAGYALMQSRSLTVNHNQSLDSEDYGILLNFITYSTLTNNTIDGVRQSEARHVEGADGKGFFIYNSLHNKILDNDVSNAEIGIHLTAGSENNIIAKNTFIKNQTQVKYVATRKQEWSLDAQGNYWSDYLGWDMNNDQIGDTYFEPNDSIDKLLWKFPQAKMLMDSPAVLLLRYIQKQFPVLKSPGVRDSFPLMTPPARKVASP
ncbi:copper-binding protein [Oleiphilus sp. HI0132]|nr:copper-binding protein [Oleiphilus sp. HI0132]